MGSIRFDDEAGLRLLLSRRVKEVLLEGLRSDGATPAELEDASNAMMAVAGQIVAALRLSVVDGIVVVGE